MTTKLDRREFLRIPANPPARSSQFADSPAALAARYASPLKVWITDAKRKIAADTSIPWTEGAAQKSETSITLYTDRKSQEILGFGAALTGAACIVFSQLPAEERASLFHTLFHPTELNFNVCRTCIGSSDCSDAVYSYDDGEVDPDLFRFSIAKDRAHILPILREARAVNPDLFLFSSPWSPPGWMKSNGSMLGGCMRHTYMPSYAQYFLKFILAYEDEGVPIQAVTIQNEVDADQDGTMPACAWPQDYEADFLTMHLGPLFQRAGNSTKIWIIDHNYNLWGRAIGELETPDVRKFTNAIAWHGYVGKPEWMRRVQNAFPDTEMYWTEGGPDYHEPSYATEWARWGQTFSSILNNGCKSITAWTLASDQNGRPYVGGSPNGIGGAMLINSSTRQISYSGMFWALGQFSKSVARGAKKIASQSPSGRLSHCAFVNLDGSIATVITNPGSAITCDLVLGEQLARVPLPTDSLTTLLTSPPTYT